MYTSSIFNIKIDFEKSHDSYIYDKNTSQYFLDFLGGYSTLPLGYNHPIFQEPSYKESIARLSTVKIPNCEWITDEGLAFQEHFTEHPDMRMFQHFYFCCTGALAVEAAIKTAMEYKGNQNIISLKNSFHGINGYGGMVSDRFPPIDNHLEGFPKATWCQDIAYPYDVAAILVEPIQSTYGDNYLGRGNLQGLRDVCIERDIILIFDEIQTGFGTTGKMWYFQHLGIEPDIVCFGKKSQVSGIMVKEKFGKIFKSPLKLDVTWDGDLIDMVRCSYILKAYEKYNLLDNARTRGEQFINGLKGMPQLKNVRGIGCMAAFDFNTHAEQESFAHKAFGNGLLFNKTRDKTIRFRPNLNASSAEIQTALDIIRNVS